MEKLLQDNLLQDNELEKVAGGAEGSTPDPKFEIGEKVRCGSYGLVGTVSDRYFNSEWTYKISLFPYYMTFKESELAKA